MERKFHDKRLRFFIGDIRDIDAVKYATKDVDYIFHLAALKHVPVCEEATSGSNQDEHHRNYQCDKRID